MKNGTRQDSEAFQMNVAHILFGLCSCFGFLL